MVLAAEKMMVRERMMAWLRANDVLEGCEAVMVRLGTELLLAWSALWVSPSWWRWRSVNASTRNEREAEKRKRLARTTGFFKVVEGRRRRREEDSRAEDGIPGLSCSEGSVALTDRLLESGWEMEEGKEWKRNGEKKMPKRNMVFLARTASRDRWHFRADFSRAMEGWRKRRVGRGMEGRRCSRKMAFLRRTAPGDRWHLRPTRREQRVWWKNGGREEEKNGRVRRRRYSVEDSLPGPNCCKGMVALTTDFPALAGVVERWWRRKAEEEWRQE
jgi:hypothetical protein